MARLSQVWEGKMPNNEMMKSTHRYGWKLSCGCDPPTDPTDPCAIGDVGLADWYIDTAELSPRTLFCGLGSLATSDEPNS
jgi:hypothetical protein